VASKPSTPRSPARKRDDLAAKAQFEKYKSDWALALLLRKYVVNVNQATPEIIEKLSTTRCTRAAHCSGGSGPWWAWALAMLLLFGLAFYSSINYQLRTKTLAVEMGAVDVCPAPWLACELGWFCGGSTAANPGQLWRITHFMSVSTLSVGSLYGSLTGFIGSTPYCWVVEMFLMVKFARMGPGSLGTGRYLSEVHHPAHA